MDDRIEAFVDLLELRAGDGLRGVFYGNFRERDYAVAYASEDALDGYEPGHVDEVVDEVVLDVLSADRKAELHDPVGPLRCTVEVYEDGVNVVVLGYEDAPTIFVGLDGDVSNVTPVLEAVQETLGA